MSLSPRVGGPVLEEGCWGAPFHDSVPQGEVGQGWATLSSSPTPISLHLPPSRQLHNFFGVSLYIALWRDRGSRMDGVWGG